MDNTVILVFAIIVIVLLTAAAVTGYVKREKYMRLRNIGKFPLHNLNEKRLKSNKPIHKYSGHRYKQKRRYNFLSQQSRRSYD